MKIKETIRKDGLRIISCHLPNRKTIQVEIAIRVGSAYDPIDKRGLFHCLEHTVFKGTKIRSVSQLQRFSGKNFLDVNAFTGFLGTTYEVTVIDHKLSFACKYLCDICFNSTFPTKELEKEKKAIFLETNRYYDNDISFLNKILRENLYRKNPINRYGGGTREGIKNITRRDLIEQKRKWYVPSSTIVIAIGNVKHKDFEQEINKHIPYKKTDVKLQIWSDEWKEYPKKREVVIKRPGRTKETILMGCKLPKDLSDFEMEMFSLFNQMIGGSSNSILWSELREKRGLAYMLSSSFIGVTGLGKLFSVYVEIDPDREEQVKKILWDVLLKPFSDKRKFGDLKERVSDIFEIQKVEYSRNYEQLIWDHVIEGKSVSNLEKESEKRLKIIKSITLSELNMIKKKFIKPERFVTIILRPRNT